jgi:YbbR domain-containing protein
MKEIMSESRAMLLRRLRQALANIRRFFDTGNLFRFLLSMLLAFGLWAWVTYENDPETTRVLGGIPVILENLESDLEIVGEPPTVDITVQGPQSVVTPMERENVVASADMSEVDQTGEHEIDVEVDVPADVRIREVVPDSIIVEVDQMGAREDVSVSVVGPDDIPPNYQVGAIDAEPDVIDIRGPERTLEQIDHAEVEVHIDGRTSSFTDSIEPRLVGENGEELVGLQLEPSEVTVTVSLEVRGQVRKIIPVIIGDDALAPGHELVRTTVLPTDEVVVDGPEEALSNVFFLTTVPVDVSGWDETQIVRDVELDLERIPDGVAVDTNSVHVSIEIRRQVHQREIEDLPISIMNKAPGTNVSLESETATVTLEGSRTAVEAIDREDMTVFINVGNAEPGTYEFELRMIVPAQVQYREISPSFVEVIVESEDADDENGDEEDDS